MPVRSGGSRAMPVPGHRPVHTDRAQAPNSRRTLPVPSLRWPGLGTGMPDPGPRGPAAIVPGPPPIAAVRAGKETAGRPSASQARTGLRPSTGRTGPEPLPTRQRRVGRRCLIGRLGVWVGTRRNGLADGFIGRSPCGFPAPMRPSPPTGAGLRQALLASTWILTAAGGDSAHGRPR